jgi:hypothetical protein
MVQSGEKGRATAQKDKWPSLAQWPVGSTSICGPAWWPDAARRGKFRFPTLVFRIERSRLK